MQTYWDFDKVGGLPTYLGHEYPAEFIAGNGEDGVVRADIYNGALILFDGPLRGTPFAAQALPLDEGLRKIVKDMVELHADDWGV